jgi:hypothetical protein
MDRSSRRRRGWIGALVALGTLGLALQADAQDRRSPRGHLPRRPPAGAGGAPRRRGCRRGPHRHHGADHPAGPGLQRPLRHRDNVAGIRAGRAGQPAPLARARRRLGGGRALAAPRRRDDAARHPARRGLQPGQGRGEFDLPPAGDPGFRMAVHAVSDEVVRWATGEPGNRRDPHRLRDCRGAAPRRSTWSTRTARTCSGSPTTARSRCPPPGRPTGGGSRTPRTAAAAPLLYERDLRTGATGLISDRRGDQHHAGLRARRAHDRLRDDGGRQHGDRHVQRASGCCRSSRRRAGASTRCRRASRRTGGSFASSRTGWASRTST